jgi:hypothetical protein
VKIEINECLDTNFCHTSEELTDLIVKYKIDFFRAHLAFSNYQLDPQSDEILKPYIDMDFFLIFKPHAFNSQTDIYLQSNTFEDDRSIISLWTNTVKSNFYIVKN